MNRTDDGSRRSLDALRKSIALTCSGPDVYWKEQQDPGHHHNLSTNSFFGRATITPFPFAVSFRYDQIPGSTILINTENDLRHLLALNQEPSIAEARHVRTCLRALAGQTVRWPHVERRTEGRSLFALRRKNSCSVDQLVFHNEGTLRIKQNSGVCWRTFNFR